jgi:SAM-dependent methyltransferase
MRLNPILKLMRRLKQFVRSRQTFDFKGFPINAGLAAHTGAPEKNYELLAQEHEQAQAELAPVEGKHVVLEAGCGTGMDAILLTKQLSAEGRYTGFDINRDNIHECTANITSRFPNFRFVHLDIYDSIYNQNGTLSPLEVQFPEEQGVVNRFIAQSVFTHLLPDVNAFYLQEIRRVLHPDGLALITCFVGDHSEIETSVENDFAFFRFPYLYAPGVYINDLKSPSEAVVYERNLFLRMIQEAGLVLTKLVPGSWASGRPPKRFGQDIVILSLAR